MMADYLHTKFVAHSSSHHYASMAFANSARIDDPRVAAQSLGELAQGAGTAQNPVYARLHNETVAEFEKAMAQMEGTESAVAFASGMAAVTACLLAAAGRGANVVAIRPLYGGTDHLLSHGLAGVEVRWATADTVGEVIDDDTALIICETPANPTLNLIDIERLVRQADGVPVLVDSTFATPVLQNPAEFGATLVLHSASKYIGGHGDVIGGVVATTEEWAAELRQIRIATGGLMHPMAAYLLRRGLATLPLRVEAAQSSAQIIAERLSEHPRVERVFYPGLAECDPEIVVDRQMRGPGAMLAFEVKELDVARGVMESVELITPAVSLGSTDSLIQHPASLTHQIVDAEARDESGVSPQLVRLSVGLEHVEDLWADLERAIWRASAINMDSAAHAFGAVDEIHRGFEALDGAIRGY